MAAAIEHPILGGQYVQRKNLKVCCELPPYIFKSNTACLNILSLFKPKYRYIYKAEESRIVPVDRAETPEGKAEAAVGVQAERHVAAGVQLTLQLHGAAKRGCAASTRQLT